MTRQEFIDDYNSWADLMEFNSLYDYGVLDEVYDQENAWAAIEERARDLLDDYGWHDAYDFLEGVPWEAEYYVQDGDGEWMDVDDGYDFDDMKQELLECADDDGIWDDDEEDEEIERAVERWTVTIPAKEVEEPKEVDLGEYIASIQPKAPETTFSLEQLFCQPSQVL